MTPQTRSITRFYPNIFGGKRSKINRYFRKNTEYRIGDPRRYPMSNCLFNFPVDISFGSTKPSEEYRLRINTPDAIRKSANKILTKRTIEAHCPVVTPYCEASEFFRGQSINEAGLVNRIGFPMVAKLKRGMGGKGMFFIDNIDDLHAFTRADIQYNSYFFEAKYNFDKEYRIHVAPLLVGTPITYSFKYSKQEEGGPITTHQSDAITRRNGEILGIQKKRRNGVAVLTRNFNRDAVIFSSNFERPPVWDSMVEASIKAAELMGLDFCCTDILYNSTTQEFVISETNTNPGMDSAPGSLTPNITAQHYQIAFPHLIHKKRTDVRIRQ